MKTMTLKEGVLRLLDGEKISIMVPQDLGCTWLDDLQEMRKLGAFCVFTEDLGIGKPEAQPEPEEPQYPQIHEDNGEATPPTVRRYLKEGGEG